jgi:SAM-dependent methyltransferase
MEDDWIAGVDLTLPNSARMYDYFIGGKNYFPADVTAARRVLQLQPLIQPSSRENRHALRRMVTHLTDLGIRQFLDIGAGLPTTGNVHEVAPDAHVVYVDNDPVVITHAQALMAGSGTDKVRVVYGDARRPDDILAHRDVATFLDFTQPIGLLMIGILHFVVDDADAYRIVGTFRNALPPGSYLAITHGCTEGFSPEIVHQVVQAYRSSAVPTQLRTAEQIGRFFDSVDMIEPGLVPITEWRPDGISEGITAEEVGVYGGVALVPASAA